MECYQFDGVPRFHMSWDRIGRELDRIGARRVMLTHMADGMLARRGDVHDPRCVPAEDGLVLEV
jgi:phosphoribosyl 1,2-cyclic phosphodiesterase